MKYRVLWRPEAELEFEQIVNEESRWKLFLSDIAKSFNERLVADPFGFGESRTPGIRVAFDKPLAIYFEIQEDVRTVIVLDIWRTDRR